jgi:hypothetical protein
MNASHVVSLPSAFSLFSLVVAANAEQVEDGDATTRRSTRVAKVGSPDPTAGSAGQPTRLLRRPRGDQGLTARQLLDLPFYHPTPFFAGASDHEKAMAGAGLGKRFGYLADMMHGDYLLGGEAGVADCYLFVMLLWAQKNGVEAPDKLAAFRDRMGGRPSVRAAMKHEGLA